MSAPSNATPATPKAYPCHCPPGSESGTVLLFYRYFANNPILPQEYQDSAANPDSLATFHRSLATPLNLTGKLRLAAEGFNITIAGPTSSITTYITTCLSHWSFTGLDLTTSDAQRAFFKPTPGCACTFPTLSIRICNEITPMAITNYAPKDWNVVRELDPRAWHDLLTAADSREDVMVLDVRNHYESSLGYFVDGDGNEAVRPLVRRFSQFPLFVRRRGVGEGKKRVLSYCTGGIRCEKASRFMAETLQGVQVLTLKGGIASYISWIDREIRAGHMRPADSLFKGRNYVFDGRGSVGLEGGGDEVVGRCVRCEGPADKMRKCGSGGCQLELVVCDACTARGVVCCQDCQDCRDLDTEMKEGARRMCQCEKGREAKLWGSDGKKTRRKQGWKAKKTEEFMGSEKRERADVLV